jgi:S1-C subfamily serine protease
MLKRTRMIKLAAILIVLSWAAVLAVGAGPTTMMAGPSVAAQLQEVSVTIHTPVSQGSGVIVTRDGVNYIWTAGHVIAGLRHERSAVDGAGATRTIVEFEDAKIVKELIEGGRAVGRLEMDAEVLRYSDAEHGQDLSLLRVRKKNFVTAGAKFYLDEEIPAVGSDLIHCGSLQGQVGSNSITTGVISQIGRVYEGEVYDQTTCAAFPGSSGGGIYLRDGRYVAMLTRGSGETFNLTIPIRRIREWAKRVGVEFAIDESVAVPTEKDLRAKPIEETSTTK